MTFEEKVQPVLRVLHVACAAVWFGSVLCVLLLVHEAPLAEEKDLFGMLRAAALISRCVLVPAGVFGTLFTGLALFLLARRTPQRTRMIGKAAMAGLLLLGVLFAAQWAGQELDAASRLGLAAYARPELAERHVLREIFGLFSVLLLLLSFALALAGHGKNISFPAPASDAETRKGNTA